MGLRGVERFFSTPQRKDSSPMCRAGYSWEWRKEMACGEPDQGCVGVESFRCRIAGRIENLVE